MKAKEKAKELISRYMNADYTDTSIHVAKQCALITVNYIINNSEEIGFEIKNSSAQGAFSIVENNEYYWLDVSKEITTL